MAVLDMNPAMKTLPLSLRHRQGVESKGLRRGLCGHGRLGNGRKKKEPSDVEV